MQSFYFKKLQVVPKKELKLLCPPRSTLYCLLTIKNHSKNQAFRDKVMTNNVSFSNLLQITKGFLLQITANFLQIATGITNYDRAHNYLTVPIGCFLLVGTIDVALHVTIVFAPAARGFRRGGTLVAWAYMKESIYSWNIQSACQNKSRFAWTGAAWNRLVIMTFLLFAPASEKWLGWRKKEYPGGIA